MRIANHAAHAAIANRKPFTGSNLQGGTWSGVTMGTGQMPYDYVRQLYADVDKHGRENVYVVWSYATPIAWCAGDIWVIPPIKYSRTTSRHQSQARRGAAPDPISA
jgi:hypothetical protein